MTSSQHIMKKYRNKSISQNKIVASFLIICTMLIGTYALVISHAQTPYVSLQAESGSLTSVAIKVANSTASGGSSVQFGSSPTTPPTTNTCPNPTPTAPVTGYTISACEDFNNGLGAFAPYDGGGGSTTVGVGRVPSQCSVTGGVLVQAQAANGATCGGQMQGFSQLYGLWEVRMKAAFTSSAGGSSPHPVLLLWPNTDVWSDGELDYVETDLGQPAGGYLHCVGNPSSNCYVIPNNSVDYSQWHTYSFLWKNNSMSGYIDGKLWWSATGSSYQPSVAMVQDIQLDNLSGNLPARAGEMDIDWVHMFK